jgi:hypothetical protein
MQLYAILAFSRGQRVKELYNYSEKTGQEPQSAYELIKPLRGKEMAMKIAYRCTNDIPRKSILFLFLSR